MEQKQLAQLFSQSAIASTEMVLSYCDHMPAFISKAQAYRLYGRSDVDRWIAEGLIVPKLFQGKISKGLIDKAVLELIAAKSNRITYLPAKQRPAR